MSAAEKEKRKKLQVTEWAKKPPCTMCASTTHGWGDCKLKAKCAFLACQCARDKACWVDADEMPSDKELLNALGKPIVGKLKEKLIKFRTDKGKTVSSIEICDECEEELAVAKAAVWVLLYAEPSAHAAIVRHLSHTLPRGVFLL